MHIPTFDRVSRLAAARVAGTSIAILVLVGGGALLSGCPPDTVAPGNISGFLATAGDSRVELSWSNPRDGDFAGVVILRKSDTYPANAQDGAVVYQGSAVKAADTGLANGVPQYYAAFAYDDVPNYASGSQATATPTVGAASAQVLEEFELLHGDVAASAAPQTAREQLLAELEAAEMSYRAGEPCAAAGHLLGYEASAQTLRQSADTDDLKGILDELYASGRLVRYEMVSSASAKDLCPGQERVGAEALQLVDETHSDNTEFQATASFGEPKLLTVRRDGKVFTQVEIPGCDNATGEPGLPAVPVFRRLIAVPEGAEVSAYWSFDEAEIIYTNLLPVQAAPVDQSPEPGPAPDASVFADRPFVLDDAVYESDEAVPYEPFKITDLGQLRDFHTFLIEAPTGRYNPVSNKLTLYKRVNIHTAFSGGSGMFASRIVNSAFESSGNLYTSVVSNFAATKKYLGEIGALFGGEEFMILTPPQFRAAADTLATWKNKKGIITRVFEVGAGTTYDTKEKIVGLIRSEYENARVRPAYVLLLGNTAFIPAYYIAPNGDVGAPTIATDYPYAAFQLLGILPRVALGRLPVRSLANANFAVSRIVSYEQSPPGDADFYSHAAIAAQFQCCVNGAVSLGTDQRTFLHTAEFCRNALLAAGKTVDRIYTETVDPAYPADSTPRRYEDGALLPADLGAGSGFGWNGDSADISSAWNAGRFLVIHRDHGWPGGWGNPSFTFADASALTNGALLPVVFSVNCASGFFDQETAAGAMGSAVNTQYFAERLLTNAGGGAIGMLGDTRNSPSWANSALLRGFVDAVWPGALPEFGDGVSHRRLGDILNHGKIYLFTQGGLAGASISWADVGDENRMWHCLGDPTLELWTKRPLQIPLSTVVELHRVGRIGLTANYATEGATLTLFHLDANFASKPLARGTVVDGVASFELLEAPQEGEALTIAATLPDAVPQEIESTIP